MINAIYTARATSAGGRNGHVKSSDGILDLEVRIPKEMGGPGGAYTNPEQLFAAGYSACFNSALGVVIAKSKVKTGETTVTAQVGIGDNGKGGYGLVISLFANVPGVEQAQAEELVAKAHEVCPYSNATRNNVEVTLVVTTEAVVNH